MPPVTTAVPTPIRSTTNRWGAGYVFTPVKGAEGYAIYSRLDNKKVISYMAARSSAFHCPNNINTCWNWTTQKNPSGSGEL